MNSRTELYIGGQWVAPVGTGTLEVTNSSTGEVVATIPEGAAEDAERAVEAAAAAFDDWSQRPVEERAAVLDRLVAGLTARADELATTIATEVGMPLPMAKMVQVGMPTGVMASYAKLARELELEEEVGNSLIVREPVGVVACITPWNYPLHQIVAKIAPAMVCGCTVVLKPSEVAPLNAFILAELVHEADVPPGVFNLVTGLGPVVGEALVAHPKTNMVSFTGSTRAGRRVSEIAARMIKRVTVELGGKSANVILEDADLAKAVKVGVSKCYLNSGQTCSALTRMLVPRSKYEEAVELAKAAAEKFTVGDALAGEAKLGPLVSQVQLERVRGYIQKGIDEGARLVTGGVEPPEGTEDGYFVRPTVFADVTNDMTIAQEEIFGPVLSIIAYEDEDDAVRIANDSIYGLGGGVWSADEARALRVARRLRTGQVEINGGRFNVMAPFGGYKQSGHGRELGRQGLEEYLETKSMQR